MTTNELIDVTVKIPRPPEGYGEPEWREPRTDDAYLLKDNRWSVATHDWTTTCICCSRVEPPYQFPANMADGWTLFPTVSGWFVTHEGDRLLRSTVQSDCWYGSDNAVLATIFADFVPPPERRPYTKGRA